MAKSYRENRVRTQQYPKGGFGNRKRRRLKVRRDRFLSRHKTHVAISLFETSQLQYSIKLCCSNI